MSATARVKWFEERPRRRRSRRSPHQLIALRLADLARIYRARYGTVLPDDDAGRDDLSVAVHHLACLPRPRQAISRWCEVWAPWLAIADLRDLTASAIASPTRWSADALAWRLGLTAGDRRALGVTTIGAIDQPKAARVRARRDAKRQRKQAVRRSAGAIDRQAYERASLASARPWAAAGISRATWYRRRRDRHACDGPAVASPAPIPPAR